MWECLTREEPYLGIPAFRVIFRVANECLRPDIPQYTVPEYISLMQSCWHDDPTRRPSFEDILQSMEALHLQELSKINVRTDTVIEPHVTRLNTTPSIN